MNLQVSKMDKTKENIQRDDFYILVFGNTFSIFSHEYYLNAEEIRIEKGIFQSSVDVINLDKIESVQYSQNFLQTLFNVGDIIIEDASGSSFKLNSVKNPKKVKNKLSKKVKANESSENKPKNTQLNLEVKKELLKHIKKINKNFDKIEKNLKE